MTMMTTDLRNAKPEIDDALRQVVKLLRGVLPAAHLASENRPSWN